MNDNPVFEIKDLKLWYGSNQALQDINMSIKEKEVLAIIGPSGCGKSSFLKTLNRMVDLVGSAKLSGEIYYLGKNIYSQETNVIELRKQVGMVFQKPNPFPQSIYENVAFAPKLHETKNKSNLDQIVKTSLQQAFLWDEVNDRLKNQALSLSGGQQQRLCIARALASKPEVILMDEPCSALDPVSTSKIESLITTLKEKYTVVIVTHNMQQAARISDRTAFFLNGELVELDKTDKVFTNPKDSRTEDYITGRFG
ncbi:phosphate ABC transporter ATP-binding protein PstB [Natranaerobius thermophilus]|uniref:Phosphate ABC transporter, ATPase subunit n=1 Tax=Natranaerobius thermophilus (strain ATCC BAA-1301 / DSM 18059 / JW/NM-WN-LF) TaxID=457570 RepID=B2A0K5_NATTJ|nr:phosphate ABC transporter ATP-binding protein PstB [Natranaerobius thermophilus]ACB84566.1 phosphate ABC transporter, ATPase subunit [Natranaerobius thermophilus JW/NM-WN-LF]